MNKLVSISTLAIAGAVTTGLIAFSTPVSAAEDGAAFQRKDDNPDVVIAVDDDDEDDTFGRDGETNTRTNANTNTGTGGGDTNTGNSRSTRDNTNSNFTGVSRNGGDISRSDKTKDWTRDGGTRTRDRSANQTNDRSRNDTRG